MKEFIEWLWSDDLPEYVIFAVITLSVFALVVVGVTALVLIGNGKPLLAIAVVFTPPALVVWYGWVNRNKEN